MDAGLGSETNQVERRGDVVLRNAGPHSETVHKLLRHLAERGFDSASRVVEPGFDAQGRETLTFIEGEMLDPRVPTVAAANAIGSMLRRLHDATRSFAADGAVWQPWFGRQIGGGPRAIGHCDAAPWNVITVEHMPVALIDWEVAGPVDPLVDLAQAAWLNARLFSDDIAEREGLPSLAERAARMRAIVDGYGLAGRQRRGFFDLMVEFAVHSIAADADEDAVTPEAQQSRALWGMAWRSRSASWMLRNRSALERALS